MHRHVLRHSYRPVSSLHRYSACAHARVDRPVHTLTCMHGRRTARTHTATNATMHTPPHPTPPARTDACSSAHAPARQPARPPACTHARTYGTQHACTLARLHAHAAVRTMAARRTTTPPTYGAAGFFFLGPFCTCAVEIPFCIWREVAQFCSLIASTNTNEGPDDASFWGSDRERKKLDPLMRPH